ncbi:possible biotin synthesis protein [Psychrobacter arcticus 273-4]|uniref:Possible biotin synthesis protein n=1 Tax=Psychrobacter arcticus (strain DSM 17307 / VKM B-2377 / 273-4) TaxID=259536 RepID=Q4FPT0_PSYA2|nr:methyltransferase domain-containing protein [Psychrobacter arcticus]AAZ19978.1 possible biotin synthesis protein [Psychrobacter arcticus 273-4]
MKAPATPDTFSTRKKAIARHFANAEDYDQHAYIQEQVCQHLLAHIAHTKQDSILEIGAGTGQMTGLLAANIQSQHWFINELCHEQAATLQSILPTANIMIGDAETMELSKDSHQIKHSLIVSANAVQWFDNPLSFVKQSAHRLQADGQLLFNTFTPDNFLQIKRLTGQGLHYPAISEWQSALKDAGFEKITLSTQRVDVPFANPYAILKHMQLTGVSTNQTQEQSSSSKPFTWTKSRLKQFEQDYWQHFSELNKEGQPYVNLTYDVLIVSAFNA